MKHSLARSILLHEWRRFLAAALAVATAISIVLLQIGMALGFAEQATFILDNSTADLWITSPKVRTFDRSGRVHKKHGLTPLIHPDVENVEMIMSNTIAFSQGGTFKMLKIIGFEVEDEMSNFPKIFGDEKRKRLAEGNAALLEKNTAQEWEVEVGDYFQTEEANIQIIGLVDDFSLGRVSTIITSTVTAAASLPNKRNDQVNYIAIKLKDGADKARVKAELMPRGYDRDYTVWESHELKKMTRDYWLSNSKLGTSFWFISIISLVVGFIIIQQIIRMLILDNIKEYATLRALGVSFRVISKVVMEKCLWIALAGFGSSVIVILLARPIASSFGFFVTFPLNLLVASLVAALVLCLAAGLLSFRVLYKSEPADLLRG